METETKIKRPRINTEAFVKAWVDAFNDGGSHHDVAEKVGCSLAGVLSKAKNLAKEGVTLPELKKAGRRSRVDTKGLNDFIKANLK